MAARSQDIQELLDDPIENLSVEYKQWLNLRENLCKAKVARCLAALANNGGGFLVFGLTDKGMKYAGPNPYPQIEINRDLVTGIVKKYLEPTFQCTVTALKSAAGNEHTIIEVPAHGAAPICAKASSPNEDKSAERIDQGVYYTRKPGPESAPILTAAEWAPIIRRCAMHDRTAILAAISAALSGAQMTPTAEEALRTWHDAAHKAFVQYVSSKSAPRFAQSNCQLSYQIDIGTGTGLNADTLREVLWRVNREVLDLVQSGESLFYPFETPKLTPQFRTDPASGEENEDFLEFRRIDPVRAELWRVSRLGSATTVRTYHEELWVRSPSMFSPNEMVRNLAECVRHAAGFAERFEYATNVSFRCEWRGLRGRTAGDPEARWIGYVAVDQDSRISEVTWPVATLRSNWTEVVAKLAASMARLFLREDSLNQQWIQSESTRWRR